MEVVTQIETSQIKPLFLVALYGDKLFLVLPIRWGESSLLFTWVTTTDSLEQSSSSDYSDGF
jgi:hypothetical protein